MNKKGHHPFPTNGLEQIEVAAEVLCTNSLKSWIDNTHSFKANPAYESHEKK